MKANKKYISQHKRKLVSGVVTIVEGHNRTYNKEKKPKPGTIQLLKITFSENPRPLDVGEISKQWKMHPRTVRKYIQILVKDKIIKKRIINGREYWELL